MRAAVTVSVISLIAVVLMIRSAGAAGFTIFEAPLVVMELMFLAAVYILWRALADGEDAYESERRPAVSQTGRLVAPPVKPAAQESGRAGRWLRFRLSGWAEWWFNGSRDPRKR